VKKYTEDWQRVFWVCAITQALFWVAVGCLIVKACGE